jgi:hypothetical protein
MPLSEGPPHGWRYSIRAWRLGRTSVTESTRISQTRAEWLFFGVDSDFALVPVAANRAAFQSSRRRSRGSSDDGSSISARVSMPLVATCIDGEGHPGVAVKSDWHHPLVSALSDVDWACLCSTSRECDPLQGCGAQKQHPSLSSLLHEPVFMMQAAEYGALRNPVSDRQSVSVVVGRGPVRDRLRQTRT